MELENIESRRSTAGATLLVYEEPWYKPLWIDVFLMAWSLESKWYFWVITIIIIKGESLQ